MSLPKSVYKQADALKVFFQDGDQSCIGVQVG